MFGKYLGAFAALMLCFPALADNPRKVAIGPTSANGALLFKTRPYWIDYQLLFTRSDKNRRPAESFLIAIKARPNDEGDRFFVESLPPGEYQLEAVYQQLKWAACLETKTLKIVIEPGRVAYIGTVDARPTLASIQNAVRVTREARAHLGEWHFYRSTVVAPAVSDRDPEGLAGAESFVRRQMPRSSAAATLADVRWEPYVKSGPSGRADRCDSVFR